MRIKIGKEYTTVDGSRVKIIKVSPYDESEYNGEIVSLGTSTVSNHGRDIGEEANWDEDGCYSAYSREFCLSIVSEYIESEEHILAAIIEVLKKIDNKLT